MVTMPKTEAEAAEMERKAAAFRQEQAQAKLAERQEQVAPLREFVDSEAFETVMAKAAELAPDFAAYEGIDVHLRPLARFMRNLREATGNFAPAPNAEPVPAPADEPPAE